MQVCEKCKNKNLFCLGCHDDYQNCFNSGHKLKCLFCENIQWNENKKIPKQKKILCSECNEKEANYPGNLDGKIITLCDSCANYFISLERFRPA